MRNLNWTTMAFAATFLACSALADDSTGSFASGVLGSTPGTTIGGVVSGAAPWSIHEGRAIVTPGGNLVVEVNALLIAAGPGIPPNLVGTTGPVQMVAASLVCGGSGGSVAASTDGVPLTASGNAQIQAKVMVPERCIAPVVLVRFFNAAAAPGAQLGPFIALTGL